jgi:hypothetical protein
MGHLENAAGTDRTSVLDSPRPRPPAVEPREPRDRGFFALVAVGVAAVVTAVVVVATSGGDEPSTVADEAVRTPAVTAPATTDPVLDAPANPTAPVGTTAAGTQAPGSSSSAAPAPAPAGSGTTGLPTGWEARTFEGVTFAVPPGATQPDVVDPGNADAPALFSWNGPSLGGEVYSHVSMWIYATGEAPTLGAEYQSISVPGADTAHMWTGPTGGQASITVDVHIVAGGRYINLNAAVAPGAAGEQTVRDLVASIVVG